MTIWAILALALVSIAGKRFGYALTLAGVAGLVISLGVTADSYIVFFERLKDEVRPRQDRRGRPCNPRSSARTSTIVAADIVTGIAAAVLYLTAVSSVRGFALTLGVATAARPVRRLLLQAADGVPDRAERRLVNCPASGSRAAWPASRARRGRSAPVPGAGVVNLTHAFFDVYRGYRVPHFQLIEHRNWWFALSGVLIVLSLLGIFVRRLQLLDRLRGRRADQLPASRPRSRRTTSQATMAQYGYTDAEVQIVGDTADRSVVDPAGQRSPALGERVTERRRTRCDWSDLARRPGC